MTKELGRYEIRCRGGCHNIAQQTDSEEKNAGWQLLFDGKTLNGWRDYNGEKLTVPWFAANGTIQAKEAVAMLTDI